MEYIGSGSYGKVYIKNNNAVKKLERIDFMLQEVISLLFLRGRKHIVKVKEYSLENLEIETELYQTDLSKLVKENNNYEIYLDDILAQIIIGLNEIHSLNLVHGDIKPNNIFCNIKQEKVEVVIGDCGFVSIGKYSKTERTAKIFSEKHLSRDQDHDLFSLGLTILFLKYKSRPREQLKYQELTKILEKLPDNKYTRAIKYLTYEDKSKRKKLFDIYQYLFNEKIPSTKYIFPIELFSSLDEKFNKPSDLFYISLRNEIKHKSFQNEINRSYRGYLALCYYIDKNKEKMLLFKKDLNILIDSVLVILSSLFGKRDFSRDYKEIKKLYCYLREYIEDRTFLEIIFYK